MYCSVLVGYIRQMLLAEVLNTGKTRGGGGAGAGGGVWGEGEAAYREGWC